LLFKIFTLILLLPILSFAAVIELSDSNINTIREEDKDQKLFIEFYAPWCSHCKRLVPVWEQLGLDFEPVPLIKIARIDCDKYKSTCRQYGITGYPTIKLFKNGKVANFKEQRLAEPIKRFIIVTEPTEEFVLLPEEGEAPKVNSPRPKVVVPDEETDVIVFEQEVAFENAIKTGLWVVKFHIGSGFDRDVQPLFQQLAAYYKTNGNTVKTAAINVYEKDALNKKYDLTGFPTFAVFQNGKLLAARSGKTNFDELVTFAYNAFKSNKRDEL